MPQLQTFCVIFKFYTKTIFLYPKFKPMSKTNAARILDYNKIKYNLVTYKVDETDLSATHVAAQLGQDVARVFKTLVLRGDKTGIFVCVVPGGNELDLKKAAKASANKSCAMVQLKDILPLTGYIRGGCTVLGMKKNYPAFIDESCLLFNSIFVSAGVRGMQIEINPTDFIKVTQCAVNSLI